MDLVTGKTPSSPFESETFDKDIAIHVNEPIGSASISPSGRDVVLASRQGLHIIDLDSPYSLPRHLPHRTPWEVADVQWSPFAARDYWVVSTSDQKALVWNLELSSPKGPIEHVLHAHTRAITDINFSAHHPDILATCAVDSFVHCWDLRRPARPVMTFCDWFAGATQVKWNRQDSHIIASSHDRFLKIWDDRKGAYPLRTIDAHATKIYGVDWNRTLATHVLTCSLDKTIKFWDYSEPGDQPERVIETPFPVWRARHTPFGWGVLAMPQRGNYDLHLYDRRKPTNTKEDNPVEPVKSIKGHKDQVKEFLWRTRGGVEDGIDNRDFQLVSWAIDRDLQLHRMDPEDLRKVGFEKGKEVHKRLNLTRRGAAYRTFRNENALRQVGSRVPSPAMLAVQSNQGLSSILRGAPADGMSRSPGKEWNISSAPISPTAMQARTVTRKRQNPITWMKGVTIRKSKDDPLDQSLRLKGSVLSPHDAEAEPETLEDEITQVGDCFKKVSFEDVDVPSRTATISLNGPWGSEQKVVYIKMKIHFPQAYPEAAAPQFTIEKTSSISDEMLDKIIGELGTVAEAHAARQRRCLEAVLRYLLGERSLEESTSWLRGDESEAIAAAGQDEDTSSDEDEIGPALNGAQAQDLEGSATDILSIVNANANVPRPRTCAAFWSRDGRLVYVLPPKEEAKSLLQTLALKDNDKSSRNQRIFEGFGRLHVDSPEPQVRTSTLRRSSSSTSDESAYTTSSSDVSSLDDLDDMRGRFQPPTAWRGADLRFARSRSADRSNRSSAGTGAKTVPSKPKSVVSIQNLEDILPSKKLFANEYAIYGDGPDVCEHNARVAEKYGHPQLAEVWHLVGLVLCNDVPLQIVEQAVRKVPIIVVARRAMVRINRKDSGLDIQFDEAEAVINPMLRGRVKWGCHPFGGKWLIDTLFQHFEKLADTQMLAMLSCIFSEPAAQEGPTNAMLHLSQSKTPMSMKSPAFSLDYFPSHDAALSLWQPSLTQTMSSSSSHTPVTTFGSASSSNGPWSSDHAASDPAHSTSITPPFLSRSNTQRAHGGQTVSISPENNHHHHHRRATTNLSTVASMIPASLSRPFSNTASSSPPLSDQRTRNGAPELSTSAPSSGITWGPPSYIDNYAHRHSHVPSEVDYYSDGSSTVEDDPIARLPRVRVQLKNQDQFDDEASATVPLLNLNQNWKYKAYREVYADLLFSWELDIIRSEILKFNGLTPYFPDRSHEPQRQLELGRKQSNAESEDAEGALKVVSICHHCKRPAETAKDDKQSKRCEACRSKRITSRCDICWEPINGLFKSCFECGHIAHAGCSRQWMEDQDGAEPQCETGCGCECTLHEVLTTTEDEWKSETDVEVDSNHDEARDNFDLDGPLARLTEKFPSVTGALSTALRQQRVKKGNQYR